MGLDRYVIVSDNCHEVYQFLSEGPNGAIKKVVYYQEIDRGVFNLAFGDWDEVTQKINDQARTNNNDRNKVLATVASTAIDFIEHHPDAVLFAKGSSPARTRLYQIGITNNIQKIDRLFEIDGFFSTEWETFQKGKDYEAFLLKPRRKS